MLQKKREHATKNGWRLEGKIQASWKTKEKGLPKEKKGGWTVKRHRGQE